jgi:hypothetical protein
MNTNIYGVPFSVEGNNRKHPYLNQIKVKFVSNYNSVENKYHLHSWDSGLTNVYTVTKDKTETPKDDDCSCKVKPVEDITEDTLKSYSYQTAAGFYARFLQVYGKCTLADKSVIELNTGSIRVAAIPEFSSHNIPCSSKASNKWIFITKSSVAGHIEVPIKRVGVVWHARPEDLVLDKLGINPEYVYNTLKKRFNHYFPQKESDEWDSTMHNNSMTWGDVRTHHTAKFVMERQKIHLFFQLIGKCGPHFTIYTDRIKHVSVWSPSTCKPRDEWVDISSYAGKTVRCFSGFCELFAKKLSINYGEFSHTSFNFPIGVSSPDYTTMRDLGVYYAHPSQDLKRNFIKHLIGKSPTYFNWTMAQYGSNWEEFLLRSNSPFNNLTEDHIIEQNYNQTRNKSIGIGIPLRVYKYVQSPITLQWFKIHTFEYAPSHYSGIGLSDVPIFKYKVWQLQGWCGDYHVKTDRIITLLTNRSYYYPAGYSDWRCNNPSSDRTILQICDNTRGNETINCTANANPIGVTFLGYPRETIELLNLTEVYGYYKSDACNLTHKYNVSAGEMLIIYQGQYRCNEKIVSQCDFSTRYLNITDLVNHYAWLENVKTLYSIPILVG